MTNKQLHIVVHGRVQGVFFRMFVRDRAISLGLTGWVKNLPDGGVEVVAEGDEESLTRLVDDCKVGPSMARVEHLQIDVKPYQGSFRNFKIER